MLCWWGPLCPNCVLHRAVLRSTASFRSKLLGLCACRTVVRVLLSCGCVYVCFCVYVRACLRRERPPLFPVPCGEGTAPVLVHSAFYARWTSSQISSVSREMEERKKKKALWGCTILIHSPVAKDCTIFPAATPD